MLDINFIRENLGLLRETIKNKQLEGTVDVDKLIKVYDKYSDVLRQVETKRNLRNNLSDAISKVSPEEKSKLVKEAVQIKEDLKKLEDELSKYKIELDKLLVWVPNVYASDVPIGKDESKNVVLRKEGKVPQFDFTPKDHLELGEKLGIIDVQRGTKVAGFRGYYLLGRGVELEQAILRFALDLMKSRGFVELRVPWMVKPEFLFGTGFFPWGEDDHYKVEEDKSLIGTAEVSLISYYANEVLDEKDLPIKLFGASPCFRREVGSYGKDTKGVFRIHEFMKVEQVVLIPADENLSKEWHEKMISYSEEFLKALGLSYQVVLMCTGELGAPQYKKIDLNTWFPSQNKYRETHSASCLLDFQARRLGIKYRGKGHESKYVYTLNNTVAATPRLLAAILENYQQKDESVVIPEALRKYTNFDVIK